VRGFLTFLKKKGMTSTSLAPHLRLRKSNMVAATTGSKERREVELTPEGHEALQAEMEALEAQRPQVREEIRLARQDKDFRENAPLDAAREKQAHLESRIQEIKETLKQAVVVGKRDETGVRVGIGATVAVTNLGSGASLRYTIVGTNEGEAAAGKISHASPIGRALMDKIKGEEVEVSVPAGVLRLRIEKIEG
jgi:transcription elongation factor GreA